MSRIGRSESPSSTRFSSEISEPKRTREEIERDFDHALSSLTRATRAAPTPEQLEGMKHHPLFDAALKSTFARSAFAFVLLFKAQLIEQSGLDQRMTPDDACSYAYSLLKCAYDWDNRSRTDKWARCFRDASRVLQLGRYDDQTKVLLYLLGASRVEADIKWRYEKLKEHLCQLPVQLKDFQGHRKQSGVEQITEEIKSAISTCTLISEDAEALVKGSDTDPDVLNLKRILRRIERIADSNYIRDRELKSSGVQVRKFPDSESMTIATRGRKGGA